MPYSSDMTTPQLKYGDVVHTGFTPGRIVRAKRMYGIDGYIVQATVRRPGDGTLPHWVPAERVHPGEQGRPGTEDVLCSLCYPRLDVGDLR